MAEEGDMENIVTSAVNTAEETGKLVEVKFVKNPNQTQKYLEAEPKALGVTQIMLSIFVFSVVCVNLSYYYSYATVIISAIISLIVIVAGSVAIAAQNLHLPTLKACLGMQVVACAFSVICVMNSIGPLVNYGYCWGQYHNSTSQENMCKRLLAIDVHLVGLQLIIHVTQIALSATLAAFCCKVIQCCSPKDNVPVIVVNAPPGPQ